jgi:carbon-monoxide dehydrogenase large subunit
VSILGHRVVRKEDPAFLRGEGRYVDGLDLGDEVLHVTFVRSPVAHARISGLDTSEAEAAPGVVAVVTGRDITPMRAPVPPFVVGAPPSMDIPYLAYDSVRYVGDPIAAVVTRERYQGPDAAELVVADYEDLPVVVDPEEALKNAVLLVPEAGTNIALEASSGSDSNLFDGCDVVVKGRFVNQRVAPAPLEVRGTAARFTRGEGFTQWASTQTPHMVRSNLESFLGLPAEQIRVITPDVGGGFGAKVGLGREDAVVAWVAHRHEATVRWNETRSESLTGWSHGRAQIQYAELGGTRDGRILAYKLHIVQDCGAYISIGPGMPNATRLVATTVYDIPRAEFSFQSVLTNTAPIGAFRGAGRPEANAAMERAVDLFARELDMDPVEVRRRNLIAPDAFPYTTHFGSEYDSGSYGAALDSVCEAAGYATLRGEQQRRRDAGEVKLLGIGVSVYVEITAGGPNPEFANVTLLPDGRARVVVGRPPSGQGHGTMWSMIAADALGIAYDDIEVSYGDTAEAPQGGFTGGSSTMQTGGTALQRATDDLIDQARAIASERLEVASEDIELDTEAGRFQVIGVPGMSFSWADIATHAGEEGIAGGGEQLEPKPTFPFGACVAVVEVDRETGGVVVERIVALDDAGKLLNPLLAEGQVHGGLAQGVAQALLEEIQYDEYGNPLTTSFADYLFVSATELPDFETLHSETPTPRNSMGVKGVGESGTMASTPAVQSAIIDALSHLGVRHIDMPCGPERVWRAIQEGGNS